MIVCNVEEFNTHKSIAEVRSLSGLSVEFTRRCNFNCEHCYLANPKPDSLNAAELTYDEWVSIFDQYAAEKGLFITITGGEPLLRSDFKNLWVYLKNKGFLISLFTNGSLIDQDMIDFLAEWTPYEVSISLYGATEETYEKVTGKKNMFKRVTDTLDLLFKKGIALEVKGVFSKANKHEFIKIKTIGEKYCDLFRWDVDLIGAFSDSSNQPQNLRLSPKECVEIEAAEPIRNKELQTRINNWKPPLSEKKREGAFTCNIGYGSAYIDSYGGMHPCLPLETVSYDLKNGSLKQGWDKAIPKMLKEFAHKSGPCQTCDAFEICGQCVAFALLEGCSATGPVPFRCQLAKERAKKYEISHMIKHMPANIDLN